MKSLQATVFALLLAAAAPLSAGIDQWSRIGPPIGGICALAAAPSRPSTVYAVSSGEIYKSTNGGRTWLLLADNGGSFAGCGDLDVDPVEPDTVYYVSPSTLFLFLKSTDGGATWTRSTLPVRQYFAKIALHPARPGTIFLSGHISFGGNPQLLRSTDGGATWTVLSSPPGEIWDLAVAPGRPLTVYVGTTSQGLFKSTNGGGSWAPANNGLDPAAGIFAIAIAPGDPRTLLVSTMKGVFRSTDGGASWVGSNQGLGSLIASEITYDPIRPATVYAGTGNGVFKSADGGLSWSPANQGLTGRYVRHIEALPDALLAGTYANGIYRSPNGAASWSPSSRGITGGLIANVEIAPGSPPVLFAADSQAGLYRRVQGQGWSLSLPERDLPGGLALDPTDPSTVYVGLGHGIARSTDSGVTWSVHSGLTCTAVEWIRIDPRQPSTLYVGGSRSPACDSPPTLCLVWKSTDSGLTWSCLREGARVGRPGGGLGGYWSYPQVQAFAVSPRGSLLHAILDNVLYISADGGVTWPEVGRVNALVLDLQIDPGNPSILYIAGNDGVPRSTDGGRTWKLMRQGFPAGREIWISTLAIDPARTSTLYAATFEGEVYKSTNSGETWRQLGKTLGPGVVVYEIEIDPLDPSTLYLGTNRGVMELTQSGRR